MLATLGRKLLPLKGSDLLWRTSAIALVVIGVTFGIFGAVQAGSIVIAIGGGLYAYVSYTASVTRRTIELLIPMGVTLLLFVLSLTLPHSK